MDIKGEEYNGFLSRSRIAFLAKIAVLILLLPVLSVSRTGAQLISISARFDTTTIMIGEQTMFIITVDQPEDMYVVFPRLQDTLAQRIEILSTVPADTITAGEGRLRITKSFRVTSFYAGEHFAGALPFAFLVDDDEKVLSTRRTRLEVLAPEVDIDAGIYDIKAPFGIPLGVAEVLPWLFALIVLAFAVWWLLRYMRKRKDAPAGEGDPGPAEPAELAHVTALRELKDLKKEALWQKGEVKEYYTRLTGITRIYIERKFGIPAMERTSEEIMNDLRRADAVDGEVTGALDGMLALADLVKFARAAPAGDENDGSLETAFHFVKATCNCHDGPAAGSIGEPKRGVEAYGMPGAGNDGTMIQDAGTAGTGEGEAPSGTTDETNINRDG